jgi:hypothetical protein
MVPAPTYAYKSMLALFELCIVFVLRLSGQSEIRPAIVYASSILVV